MKQNYDKNVKKYQEFIFAQTTFLDSSINIFKIVTTFGNNESYKILKIIIVE